MAARTLSVIAALAFLAVASAKAAGEACDSSLDECDGSLTCWFGTCTSFNGLSGSACTAHTDCDPSDTTTTDRTDYCKQSGGSGSCYDCSTDFLGSQECDGSIDDKCPCYCGKAGENGCSEVCKSRKEYCKTEAKTRKKYFGKITLASIFAALLGITSIVLGCLPTCCAVMVPQAKILGGVGTVCALFAFVTPKIGANMAAGSVVKGCCKGDKAICCDGGNSDDMHKFLKGLGTIVAYTVCLGFLGCITGGVGAGMSGAAMCGCCKADPNKQPGAVQAAVVQGTVTG